MDKNYGRYFPIRSDKKRFKGVTTLVANENIQFFLLKTVILINQKEGSIAKKMKILKSLNHPYVENFVDIIQQHREFDDVLSLVMDYYQNEALEDRFDDMTEIQIRNAILDLCSALRYLHEDMHILYGALHFQDVLIQNQHLVITQFSKSEFLTQGKLLSGLKGKLQYMSPQMVEGKFYGFQNDIWALGILILQIIFKTPLKNILKVLPISDPEFPNNLLNKIPNKTIAKILKDMLNKQSNRISIKEVQQRFKLAFEQNPLPIKLHGRYTQFKALSQSSFLIQILQNRQIFKLKKIINESKALHLRTQIQKLKQFNHRNIVSIKDAIINQNQLGIITQYYKENYLSQYLSNLSQFETIEAIKDVWEGFSYLYQNKQVILDNLKPQRIVRHKNRNKLLPFSENSFKAVKESQTDSNCIQALVSTFLKILFHNNYKQFQIEQKNVVQCTDKRLQKFAKTIMLYSMQFTLEQLSNLIKKQIYPLKIIKQDIIIGDYKILKMISKGRFGTVYVAEHMKTKQKVALKTIYAKQKQISEFELNEALISKQLKHLNVVETYEYFIWHKYELVIIMELCEERTLKQTLGSFKNMTEKLQMMSHVAEGLNYLHSKFIIHRDLKPLNILQKDGILKIGDLGVAAYLKPGNKIGRYGGVCYLSPQLIKTNQCSHSTDIWNLGIVFMQIFFNKNFSQKGGVLSSIQGFPQSDLSQIKILKLRSLVSKMLERNPQRRLSAQEVVSRVNKLILQHQKQPFSE